MCLASTVSSHEIHAFSLGVIGNEQHGTLTVAAAWISLFDGMVHTWRSDGHLPSIDSFGCTPDRESPVSRRLCSTEIVCDSLIVSYLFGNQKGKLCFLYKIVYSSFPRRTGTTRPGDEDSVSTCGAANDEVISFAGHEALNTHPACAAGGGVLPSL